MALIDQRPERWYCRQDGQIYHATEQEWIEVSPAKRFQSKTTRGGVLGFSETIGLGIGFFLLGLVAILAALAIIYWLWVTG
jgi:hypothetical protein